jgi:hypothetical protein
LHGFLSDMSKSIKMIDISHETQRLADKHKMVQLGKFTEIKHSIEDWKYTDRRTGKLYGLYTLQNR